MTMKTPHPGDTAIDRLAPYLHTPCIQHHGELLRDRPEGRCLGCQQEITHISDYNPIATTLHDGQLLCQFCTIQFHQAEHYGWHPATPETPLPDHWNPWPPNEEQLSWVWDGTTFQDFRAHYNGPRR
jgi:hypothetical protein